MPDALGVQIVGVRLGNSFTYVKPRSLLGITNFNELLRDHFAQEWVVMERSIALPRCFHQQRVGI